MESWCGRHMKWGWETFFLDLHYFTRLLRCQPSYHDLTGQRNQRRCTFNQSTSHRIKHVVYRLHQETTAVGNSDHTIPDTRNLAKPMTSPVYNSRLIQFGRNSGIPTKHNHVSIECSPQYIQQHGHGVGVPKEPIARLRTSEVQVDHFLSSSVPMWCMIFTSARRPSLLIFSVGSS